MTSAQSSNTNFSETDFNLLEEQAQLELLYSKFKQKDYEGAIALAERFIRLNPQHPNVDYRFS